MRHGIRGALTAWLGLIVLETVATTGSGRVAAAFADVNRLLQRALDPNVPAIPDRSAGGSAASATPNSPYSRPADMPVPGPFLNPATRGRVGGVYAN